MTELIKGDSSDIWEFYSKEIPELDNFWSGKWVISENLGDNIILQGELTKNKNIYYNNSLINEDFRKTYIIFEELKTEEVIFNNDIIENNKVTISGNININLVPEINKYITIKIKGIFTESKREIRVKTDKLGNFSCIFDLSPTVKTSENSFFIFQLSPTDSEKLNVSTYSLSIEIKQEDINSKVIFRKEILQTKLKILQQGVL